MAQMDFWYEFASTYSYLSVMRISDLAAKAGVTVRWRPFLLGPIFQAQGWTTSPFNIYKAKGANMARDMERLCAERKLAFRMPAVFPVNGLSAARMALVGLERGWGEAFTRGVYTAQFAEGRDISDLAELAQIVEGLGVDAAEVLASIRQADVKDKLKTQTQAAIASGVFGAPSFVVRGGELFWGDDRLEQALRWAQRDAAS